MMISRFLFITLLFICFSKKSSGQEAIQLKNPSFEAPPRMGVQYSQNISGWNDCGLLRFPGQSPPDILPTVNHAWGVDVAAKDGNTYLSLVVREDDSWEYVSQNLKTSLDTSKCYSVKAFLCHADKFESRTRISDTLVSYAHPVVLLIWGGSASCKKESLLASSLPIENLDWQQYTFTFQPDGFYKHIILEAYYVKTKRGPYNGHVLVDGLSAIVEVECK